MPATPSKIGPLRRVMMPSWISALTRLSALFLVAGLAWMVWPDLFGGVPRRGPTSWLLVIVPAAAALALGRHARKVGVRLHETGLSVWSGDGFREVPFDDIDSCVFRSDRSFLQIRSGDEVDLPRFAHSSKTLRAALEDGVAHSTTAGSLASPSGR